MQKKKKVTTSKTKTAKKAPAQSTPKAKARVQAPKAAAPAKAAKVVAQPKAASEPKVQDVETFKPRIDIKTLSADAQEQYKKWLKLQKQLSEQKAEDYKMTSDYEVKVPLKHKVHGWGVVIQKRDNYIDVLFEVGMKTLIVNYR